MNIRSHRGTISSDSIKAAMFKALDQVVDPLIELMLETGVTVRDLNRLIRERAVHVAMKHLIAAGNKESKSRASIMTGIPRSEVAKILRPKRQSETVKPGSLPTSRILAGWHNDPRFSGPKGNPAVLSIFGRTASFEQLVNRYGGGRPIRALLDELTQIQAVEQLPEQKVRIRSSVPNATSLTPQSIAAVGERGRDLLRTLAYNRQRSGHQLFEATAASIVADRELIASLRKELALRGAEFINEATALLSHFELKRKSDTKASKCRLGISVFCFEDAIEKNRKVAANVNIRRKNLRRQKAKATPRKVAQPKE